MCNYIINEYFRQTCAYLLSLWRMCTDDIVQFTMFFGFILVAFSGCLLLSLRGEGSLEKFSESRYVLFTLFFLFYKLLNIGVLNIYVD